MLRTNLYEHRLLVSQDSTYPACVGLVLIGYWKRWESWTDKQERKWPLHLRYLPPKWVTWDRKGAKLKLPFIVK